MFATSTGGAAGALPSRIESTSAAPGRIERFIAHTQFDRPTLVMDLEAVAEAYRGLAEGLGTGQGGAEIHYAVKANPAPEILERLVALGSRFDAASRAEVAACLGAGARPEEVSFGNTVKKVSDIAWAHARGIDLFAADSDEELAKIADAAPGARVYLRLLIETTEADWPLSRKFGTTPEETLRLMGVAAALGLRPVGLSFHVGSQTREARMWAGALDMAASVWQRARAAGHPMEVLNLGGGFPAFYGDAVQERISYGREIMAMVRDRFGAVPYVMAEPGRGLVAEAGVIAAEVLLVSRKRPEDIARWVYLDIGKFSGLAETMEEAIRYRFESDADGGPTGPCVLAGPSCDSADVLYEKRPVQLPLALKAGDKVRILATGAYTTTYASVGFNGFPPLAVVCL